MDQYFFNLKCLREWSGFDSKEQRIILKYFKKMSSIKWNRLSQCEFGYNIEEKRKIPLKESMFEFVEKYHVLNQQLKREGVNYLTPYSIDYPDFFRYVDVSPEILYYKGNPKLLSQAPRVAIVGSRRPTAYGRRAAAEVTRFLVKNGITVVSGLALGVDAIAHRTALDQGGKTIAILASGVLNIYPKTNTSIYKDILNEKGLIVSEKPLYESPKPYEFPLRNRLISGVSDAVIIIEASMASGTLTTAQHALVQGKPIFALPGSIYSEMSAGTNQLIYDGANPLINYEDVLLSIGCKPLGKVENQQVCIENLSELSQNLYKILSEKKKMDLSHMEKQLNCENSEIISAVNELVVEGVCEFETLTEIRLV